MFENQCRSVRASPNATHADLDVLCRTIVAVPYESAHGKRDRITANVPMRASAKRVAAWFVRRVRYRLQVGDDDVRMQLSRWRAPAPAAARSPTHDPLRGRSMVRESVDEKDGSRAVRRRREKRWCSTTDDLERLRASLRDRTSSRLPTARPGNACAASTRSITICLELGESSVSAKLRPSRTAVRKVSK
jgi:hypothetical protein